MKPSERTLLRLVLTLTVSCMVLSEYFHLYHNVPYSSKGSLQQCVYRLYYHAIAGLPDCWALDWYAPARIRKEKAHNSPQVSELALYFQGGLGFEKFGYKQADPELKFGSYSKLGFFSHIFGTWNITRLISPQGRFVVYVTLLTNLQESSTVFKRRL